MIPECADEKDIAEINPKRKFYWRRAGDHFKDLGIEMTVFDGIDPTDIVQGKIANCYFLAAVAGLAEDPPDLKEEEKHLHISDGMSENQINRGLRLRDNFKT